MEAESVYSSFAATAAALFGERHLHQRRLALESVERDAARAWPTIRKEWQHDKDFILAALKSPTLPPKSDFERKIGQSLRFDRDVVLAFCARPDFEELYYSRHLFVPDCLTGDKQVMLAYCRRIPRSLQECTEDLCNDRQVVQAAIALDGLELQYASLRLQEERDLVMAACQKDGRALEFCPPGLVREELTNNREFMLQVLANDGGPMLRLAPDALKRDRQLVLQALANGMRFRFVPPEFLDDLSFLLDAVSRKSSLYLDMNRNLQGIQSLASAAVVATDSTPDIHKRALANCPGLAQDRQAVLAFCQRGENDFLERLLESNRFADDKPIMMEAIQRDCRLFKSASERLRQDPDVILVSINESSAWATLKTIPWGIQRRHPSITIKSIELCCYRNIRYLPSHVPEDIWTSRDIVLAWIKRGGRVLDAFERTLARDRPLALALAEFNWAEFHKVGDALARDKEFMLQAVQRDGRVLRFASPEIRQDFTVVIQAVANHKETLAFCAGVDQAAFKNTVQEKMKLHETFLNDFLRGIAVVTPHVPPARRSHLPMLDRGVETSQAFKRLIAEYLGVPVGKELTLLRTAWNNLESLLASAGSSSAASTSTNQGNLPTEWAAVPNNLHPAWAIGRMAHYRNRRQQQLLLQRRADAAGVLEPQLLLLRDQNIDGGPRNEGLPQPRGGRAGRLFLFAGGVNGFNAMAGIEPNDDGHDDELPPAHLPIDPMLEEVARARDHLFAFLEDELDDEELDQFML
jgi:hypothetical protein